jgi:hypothetical protein
MCSSTCCASRNSDILCYEPTSDATELEGTPMRQTSADASIPCLWRMMGLQMTVAVVVVVVVLLCKAASALLKGPLKIPSQG